MCKCENVKFLRRWCVSDIVTDKQRLCGILLLVGFSPGLQPIIGLREFRVSPSLPHVVLASVGEEQSLLKSASAPTVYLHYTEYLICKVKLVKTYNFRSLVESHCSGRKILPKCWPDHLPHPSQ